MEVHFTPEQEAQLSQIASHAGTDTEHLVKDAALRLVEENARFRAAVREAWSRRTGESLSTMMKSACGLTAGTLLTASAGLRSPSATSKPFPAISKDSVILPPRTGYAASFTTPFKCSGAFPKAAKPAWKRGPASWYFRRAVLHRGVPAYARRSRPNLTHLAWRTTAARLTPAALAYGQALR